MKRFFCLSILVSLVLTSLTSASEWEVRATDDAAAAILCEQTPVVRSHYVFWGENWKWAGAELKLDEPDGGPTATFSGTVAQLGLTIEGTIRSPAAQPIAVHLADRGRKRPARASSAAAWSSNSCWTAPSLGKELPEPELLPDNKGWKWQADGRGPITVEFDPPIASSISSGARSTRSARCSSGETSPRGPHTVTMTVTLPARRPGGQDAGPALRPGRPVRLVLPARCGTTPAPST